MIVLKHLCLLLILFTSVSVNNAQTPAARAGSNVETVKLQSKLMGAEMPYNVILPTDYAQKSDAKYPVLYLLHGLTGSYSDWAGKSQIAKYAAQYPFIIVMPEGKNGWYTDSPTVATDKYESYIVQELIPAIESRYRAARTREGRAIAGLSMGGYGALKFGLKYPDKFVFAASLSGALGAAGYDPTEIKDETVKSTLERAFGPMGDPTRAANDIMKFVETATPERIKTLPYIYLDCGTEDFLIENNRNFSAALIKQKIPHEFRELPGEHNWPYWDQQVQAVLKIAAQKTTMMTTPVPAR